MRSLKWNNEFHFILAGFFSTKNLVDIGKLIRYKSLRMLSVSPHSCLSKHTETFILTPILKPCTKPKVCISKVAKIENMWFSIHADRQEKKYI